MAPPSRLPTETELEALYALGYGYLQNGKLQPAAELFGLLTVYAPGSPRYWCGLGACAHGAGLLDEALAAYTMAAHLDPSDSLAATNRAEILLALGNRDQARSILKPVVASGVPATPAGRRAALLFDAAQEVP